MYFLELQVVSSFTKYDVSHFFLIILNLLQWFQREERRGKGNRDVIMPP